MSGKQIAAVPLDLSKPRNEYCLFGLRVVNRARQAYSCIRCFCSTGLANRIQSFEIYITHHIANGPHRPHLCMFCHQDLIKKRQVSDCPRCSNSYPTVLRHFRTHNLDVHETEFIFDLFNNRFEHLRPMNHPLPATNQPTNSN